MIPDKKDPGKMKRPFHQTAAWFAKYAQAVPGKRGMGLVSERFIGALRKEDGFAAKSSEVFRSIIPCGLNGLATLKFDLIESPSSSLLFLEDHSSGEIREILATNGSREKIYLSLDLGIHWVRIFAEYPWDSKIWAAFSLSKGGRLIRTFSGQMYHFNARGELVSSEKTGERHWHGSQGIGESLSGTVMYAEYAPLSDTDGIQKLHVWRYQPNQGKSGWQKVFTLPAAFRSPEGEIRHFHVCRPNPVFPNQWVLASGDTKTQCRLWLSFNDGDTWTEIQIPQPVFSDVSENIPLSAFRFTQFCALENGDLIWGTDDITGSRRAALIRMVVGNGTSSLKLLGWLGKNCIRNISSYDNRMFLLLSESKHDRSTADFILYDVATNRITPLLLPNVSQGSDSVTESLGSEKLVNGVGFYPALGAVLMNPKKRGIFRVMIEEMA